MKSKMNTNEIQNCWDRNRLDERLAELQIEKIDLDNLYKGVCILQ